MKLLKKLLFPILLLLGLLMWPLRLRAKRKASGKDGLLELWLEGSVDELTGEENLQKQLVRRLMKKPTPPSVNLRRLSALVEEAKADTRVQGVIVRLGALDGGWSRITDVRALLLELREAGREVVVFLRRHASNRELYVASAASQIWMTPTAGIAPLGAAAPGRFMGAAFKRIGVDWEVVSRGRYKSAPDRTAGTERSEADHEQVKALVDAIDAQVKDALTEGRGISPEKAGQLIEASPMIGKNAAEAGLVDRVLREEELDAEVQDYLQKEEPPKLVPAGRYLQVRKPKLPRFSKPRQVGVVDVSGAIVDEAPGFGGRGSFAVQAPVVASLRSALEDDKIGAVVLRVNSPGGSVTASDAIYGAIKRLDAEKPVIAHFADVAASGGYYVGCGARRIIASPLTITGSIGVYAMLPTVPRLAELLSIGTDVIKNQPHADLYNPWSGWNDADRARADSEVGSMYEAFLEIVGEARSGRSPAHPAPRAGARCAPCSADKPPARGLPASNQGPARDRTTLRALRGLPASHHAPCPERERRWARCATCSAEKPPARGLPASHHAPALDRTTLGALRDMLGEKPPACGLPASHHAPCPERNDIGRAARRARRINRLGLNGTPLRALRTVHRSVGAQACLRLVVVNDLPITDTAGMLRR